jgi:V-type H+-transporting ATPase subunit C
VLFRFEKELTALHPKFDLKVDGTTLQSYLCNFVWSTSRFSTTAHSAQSLVDLIKKELIEKDLDVKKVSSEYNFAKQALEGLTRKSTGTLASRSMADLVTKEDLIPPSEYLVAVFLVVGSGDAKKFETTYDTLTSFVVPDSLKKVFSEGDFTLYRVVLFKNVLKEYKDKARELKWILREYEHSESRKEEDKKELAKAKFDAEATSKKLEKLLSTLYPDTFILVAHLKALRVYCESVLRFGMPQSSQFCNAILLVKRGKYEDLRRTLTGLYKHLADDAFIPSEEELLANVEVHPYVSFHLNVHGPEFRDL